ncbi:calponin homology domain-containing protein DDB_G0272472-like isoform X2 [Metopolophium dirhodum]|uniref:calponin homology domain-containing protein DDB_G0272472-like isoform X2 n=1 Tax=Metopolophium dirhodum TaxID=44670 RepID=UPI0029901531|nr:calponin homology domain-containing protein DDB_G0272472-like isoform X2 [Metopolophium dirhodum]
METSYISNGLSSPLSASSPLKRNAERKINYSSIDSLLHEMVNTYEYNDKLLRNVDNGHAQPNVSSQKKNVRSAVLTKTTVCDESDDNNLQSLCDDLVNVTPHVTTALNDYQKLDSVSKENLWLKLGKEIYHRQNIEKKCIDLEEKLTNCEKKLVEYKEVDCQKNDLLDDLAARSAMILSQIAEKCNRSINKCSELEKEVLVLNQEKKVLCEKTLKYDQLLDQKRGIEDIVDQMKSTQAKTAVELDAANKKVRTVKNDLKIFYQKQLDAMLAEKVSDYQRKLDGIVQITNEETKLIKLQMNNQIINFKERYEKEKAQINSKHREELERFEVIINDKLECISALEKRLEAEVQEKRQLVKSVMGVVKNVNIDNQSNSKLNSDIKYQRKKPNNNSNSSSKLEDDFSFFEQERLLHQVTPSELRKHIENLLNKYPGDPLAQT